MNWTNINACLVIVPLAFAQNVAFSLVSRARNRNNTNYHIVAATLSNAVWFMTFNKLVALGMSWLLFVPYTIGTVTGSVYGANVSMKIEKWLGAVSDEHVKKI